MLSFNPETLKLSYVEMEYSSVCRVRSGANNFSKYHLLHPPCLDGSFMVQEAIYTFPIVGPGKPTHHKGLWDRQTWILAPALTLPTCVTLGRLLSLSENWFSPL